MKEYMENQHNEPELLMQSEVLSYDINDVDGQLSMLDSDFSGCVTMAFSKAMDPSSDGIAHLGGSRVSWCLKQVAMAQNAWVLGIRIAGVADEYDTDYVLHIEGFQDINGNRMAPTDIPVKTKPQTVPESEFAAHESIALKAAEEGIVLLKNQNDILPLRPGTLNIFGNGFHLFRSSVVGAGSINSRYTVSLKEAINCSEDYILNKELAEFYKNNLTPMPDKTILDKALALSDTAIVVLTRFSGENNDSSAREGEYYLSNEEDVIISSVTKQFRHTVVILNVPYPIDVRFAESYNVDALLYTGIGGMLGGQAALNVLAGKVNPSGKLPDTWPLNYHDLPSSRNFYDGAEGNGLLDSDADVWVDTVYEEGIYMGYRYFDTFDTKAAYPFGYGLSYTTFEIKDIQVSYVWQALHCSAVVTNTGSKAGREVVQVYVSKPDGRLEQPKKELVGFEKTGLLQPGEEQAVTFIVPDRHMASYDESSAAYMMEAGNYSVYIGTSVLSAAKKGAFSLAEDKLIKQVKHRMLPVQDITTLSKADPKTTFPTGKHSGIKNDAQGIEPKRTIQSHKPHSKFIQPGGPIGFSQVIQDPGKTEEFVAQLSIEELCRLTVCSSMGWAMEDMGVAGRLAKLESYELTPFLVADGNTGVHVKVPNIGLPATTTCCASFDKKLMMDIGRVLGEEAKNFEISMMLVPAMNLHRNPLNGRHAEYFSEDPFLAGIMAGHYCKGLEESGVGGCYKHCIANNCESARKRNQSIMTERTLRDIYLRAFELAMEVHQASSIMTGYNAVNGVHTAADTELIRGLFRDEIGFEGFVMTDWGSYDSCDIVDMVLGGNNWITPGTADDKYTAPLRAAVADGRLPVDVLQESVSYLLRVIARLSSARA